MKKWLTKDKHFVGIGDIVYGWLDGRPAKIYKHKSDEKESDCVYVDKNKNNGETRIYVRSFYYSRYYAYLDGFSHFKQHRANLESQLKNCNETIVATRKKLKQELKKNS